MSDFLSTRGFMPHGHCFLWKPELLSLHVISDAIIALSYYSIPFLLFYFVFKRRDVPFHWVFILFGIFIFACGTTHLMNIWNFWHTDYWHEGAVKGVTAAASLLTAGLLAPLVPKLLTMPNPYIRELERMNESLKGEIVERKRVETELKAQAEELMKANEELSRMNQAMVGRELKMIELKSEFARLKNQRE